MKKLLLVLGLVGVMILVVSPVFGSQIMGTPLRSDPGVHARIMRSPRPEGFSFGRALPPSIDLEVEWKPIGAGDIDRIHRRRIFIGDEDMYRSIRGIFIDRGGTIRVVDIHPQAMTGMRLWRTDDSGKNWRVERETGDAWRDRGVSLIGREKGEVLFIEERYIGSPPFQSWPLEVEKLIKTVFRGRYEQRAHTSGGKRFFLASDSNNPKIMAFMTTRGLAPRRTIRIFITVDKGKEWVEINPLDQSAFVSSDDVKVKSVAIKKTSNQITVFVGQRGSGPRMVQVATIPLPELQEVLIAKE